MAVPRSGSGPVAAHTDPAAGQDVALVPVEVPITLRRVGLRRYPVKPSAVSYSRGSITSCRHRSSQ
ncbi:hypothetical protein GA0070613_1105 [Micromonospora inositola]|uniref:Uncharacterized protein n=1 Tax=Micromonospora inositola TaxID=47865 RepID=A0A1C5HDC1_9ACTN|nr:hypothetical protein GA0070613_1105 [Micromonospora inositola]